MLATWPWIKKCRQNGKLFPTRSLVPHQAYKSQRYNIMKNITLLLALFVFLTACQEEDMPQGVPASAYRSGGETTVFGFHSQMFQQPAANMDAQGGKDHFTADADFGSIFVTAPSAIQGGLGPLFNQSNCESCHIRNGRAAFPTSGNDLGGFLLRLSIPGENALGEPLEVPGFGGQLQTKAVWGKQAEAQVSVTFQVALIDFLDGTSASLQKPVFNLEAPYIPFPPTAMISPRMAPPVFGLGLLEAISYRRYTGAGG
jgi:CxxC motif-containing protein (DUF1111 family)